MLPAARAVAEQDRDRLFIGPGWLKEPRVRITVVTLIARFTEFDGCCGLRARM
jgi:hypothetical protein